MLSNLEKWNTEDFRRKELFPALESKLEKSYDYFVKEIRIDDDLIKKIFIVDIRDMSDKKIDYIFNNFYEFQRVILSDDYFRYSDLENKTFTYSSNLYLIFLYDRSRKYNINKHSVSYDMNFALKKFMNEEELNELLNKDYFRLDLDKEKLVQLKDRVLKLKSFNYINGNNGTGKTMLLRDISNSIKVPMFSMNDIDLDLDNYIFDKEYVRKYLYQLIGSYEIDKYSNYQKYLYRLAQILEFSREHNNMLLLDDLRWNSLDSRNTLNVIDTLFDYSLNNEGIVITGCNQSKNIRRRVYKSNIIEL